MTIRILINGAAGKMGQLAVQTLEGQADFKIVAKTGKDDNLASILEKTKPDIAIDFTHATEVLKNTAIFIEHHVRPVIGTSGLLKDQVEKFQKECKKIKLGGLIAPNFSIGAVLMMKHAQEIAKYFPQVEIIEMHHDGKLDSPSGTAVRTAEMLAVARNPSTTAPKSTRETVPGARGANYQNIPIHAIRLPGLVAHQQILFGGSGETLTLRHDSIDRHCFMPGLLLACRKVMNIDELIYGLENILE